MQAAHLVQADWRVPGATNVTRSLVVSRSNWCPGLITSWVAVLCTLARVLLGQHATYTIDTGPHTSVQQVLNWIAHQLGTLD